MAAVWNATTRRPSVLFQHVQYPHVFDQSVTERAIELQNVAIVAHTRVTDQIACILNRKKILTGGHRTLIVVGKFGLQFIIEWITGFLVPTQPVWFKSMRVSYRGLEIETPIGVHR